jgi:hypothetical protein
MATGVSGLNPEEVTKLVEILSLSTATFPDINAEFERSFSAERHGSVVAFLRHLLDSPFGLADNPSVVPQTLITYHLLRQVQLSVGQGPRRNPVANYVRAAQFHELQRLEGLLREDAKAAESHKYKQQSNEKSGGKKQTAKEAAEIDIGRCRLLMKCTLFRHLTNRPDAESVAELLNTPRASLEAEADAWSAQPQLKQALIEAISELKSAAEGEGSVSMSGAASKAAVFMFDEQDQSLAPATSTMRPVWARPAPTMLPITASELRFLTAPSISSSLVIETTAYSPEWKTATTLLATARAQPLTAAQHQQLVQAVSKSGGHINLTVAAFLEVSEHNPQTAAGLVQSVSQPEMYIDALISLPNAAGCLRSEVLLAAASVLQPHQVSAYIKGMAMHIRTQPKAAQPEHVATFAVTLHQLAKKHPLSKADQDIVAPLFNEHSSVPDVNSLWASLLKA